MNANERHNREERNELRQSMRLALAKLNRGERLSFAERSGLNKASDRLIELDEAIHAAESARAEGDSFYYPNAPEIGGSSFQDSESRAFTRYLRDGIRSPELRAAGEGTNTAGGFLVPPGWWQRLQIALKAYGGIAGDFQPLETDTGQPMVWATNNPTSTVATLVSENTQLSNVDYVFGQGTMGAYMYSNGVQLVSLQLAQDSAFDIDSYVQNRVGEALGRALSAAAVSGTGASQPLGITTALNAGGAVSGQNGGGFVQLTAATGVNVYGTTGTAPAGTNYVQTTELLSGALAPQTVAKVIGSVDPAYRKLGAKWYLNDLTLQAMRNVVDGFGRPLYTEILDDSKPMLRGYPVVVDNNLASLTASTTAGPVFGHLPSAMVLRMVRGANVLRLDQRYADFLQIGFIGYQRWDIRSNDLRAAVTVKSAAS